MSQSVCESDSMPGRRTNFIDFYRVLPKWFVDEAVAAVNAMKGEVKEPTWSDNYVARLWDILEIFSAYSVSGGIQWLPDEGMQYDALALQAFFYECTTNPHRAPRTRSKIRNCINKVCRILVREGVLPEVIMIRGAPTTERFESGKRSWPVRGLPRVDRAAAPGSPFIAVSEKHGRYYDYRAFEALGVTFLRHLVHSLEAAYNKLSSKVAKNRHEALHDLLHFLLGRKKANSDKRFFTALESNAYWSLTKEHWEVEVGLWRELQRRSTSTGVAHNIQTGNARVKALAEILSTLGRQSILPPLAIKGFRKYKARATVLRRTRAVLAQLPRKSPSQVTPEMPKELLASLSRYFPEQSAFDEAKEFLWALYRELGPNKLAALSPDTAAEMMFDLNAARLKSLRDYFEQVFRGWLKHWEYGQNALRRAEKTGEEIIELVDSDRYTQSERRENSRRLFGKVDDEIKLGNLLSYVTAQHKGILSGIHGRLHHLSRELGGKARLTAYLHPHPDATIALWGLVMIDTFANAEVAREMPWKCIHKSANPKYKKLDLGTKARALDKRILDELPSRSDGRQLAVPQALIAFKQMAKQMHKMATARVGPALLLLYERCGRIDVLPEWTARNRMTLLLNQDQRFASWGLTPSMIRPSALMNAERSDEVQMPVAQAYADHKNRSTTANSYTGQAPFRILAYAELRKYQEQYQAVTIVCDESSAGALGLSSIELEHLRSEAARTGMGVACRDRTAGAQPGTSPGEPCDRWDQCSGCSQRYVVATEDNFADLILLNEYVTEKVRKAEGNGMEVEDKILQYKCFTDAVIDKASQSAAAGTLEAGRELAATRRALYFEAIFEG